MESNREKVRAVGRAMAKLREKKGLSQAELARRLCYTDHVHLSRVGNGQKSLSQGVLSEIADFAWPLVLVFRHAILIF